MGVVKFTVSSLREKLEGGNKAFLVAALAALPKALAALPKALAAFVAALTVVNAELTYAGASGCILLNASTMASSINLFFVN